MSHLHSAVKVEPDQVVHVTLAGSAANVLLLDDANYEHYREGREYGYEAGGYFSHSPVVLRPPRAGRWHLVVDLGGRPGQVNACVALRPAAVAP